MLGNRSWEEWIRQYSASHQNPVNRVCHTVGIPMIVISLLLIPVALWRTVAKCVKPNGAVLIVDLLRPPDHETAVRLVDQHANDAPPVLRRDFIASLHAAYTLDEVRQQLIAAGLPQFRVDQVDELHLVVWGNSGTVA